jgi:hypothetical protein
MGGKHHEEFEEAREKNTIHKEGEDSNIMRTNTLVPCRWVIIQTRENRMNFRLTNRWCGEEDRLTQIVMNNKTVGMFSLRKIGKFPKRLMVTLKQRKP